MRHTHKNKIIKTLSSSYGHDYAYACIMVTLVLMLMLVLVSIVRTGLKISRMNSTCQNFGQSKTGLAREGAKKRDLLRAKP